MAMKNRQFWFTLSACVLVVAGLWWMSSFFVDPEYAPPPATGHEDIGRTQTARGPSLARRDPVIPEAKPVPSPPSSAAQTFGVPGELKDAFNPPLITAVEEVVRDTGEFLDPDAEIPPQSLDGVAEPMDTGPFINADPPSH